MEESAEDIEVNARDPNRPVRNPLPVSCVRNDEQTQACDWEEQQLTKPYVTNLPPRWTCVSG
jgi:hypothetical protein